MGVNEDLIVKIQKRPPSLKGKEFEPIISNVEGGAKSTMN